MFVSFLEHTGSVLQNSEHLLMSSHNRGYLTAQTGLTMNHFLYVVVFLWKNLIAFGDLNKLSCGGLSMYFLRNPSQCNSAVFQAFLRRKITL